MMYGGRYTSSVGGRAGGGYMMYLRGVIWMLCTGVSFSVIHLC